MSVANSFVSVIASSVPDQAMLAITWDRTDLGLRRGLADAVGRSLPLSQSSLNARSVD